MLHAPTQKWYRTDTSEHYLNCETFVKREMHFYWTYSLKTGYFQSDKRDVCTREYCSFRRLFSFPHHGRICFSMYARGSCAQSVVNEQRISRHPSRWQIFMHHLGGSSVNDITPPQVCPSCSCDASISFFGRQKCSRDELSERKEKRGKIEEAAFNVETLLHKQ